MERAPPPPKIANLPHYVSRGRDKKVRSVVGIWGVEQLCLHANNREPAPLRSPGPVATVARIWDRSHPDRPRTHVGRRPVVPDAGRT
jgi:hypothetical protein